MNQPRFKIKELKPINVQDGFLVDGFPSAGFASAIASESLIHTTGFEVAAIIDSDTFPPVSLIKDGIPNYPTRIFVQNELNVAIFSSYLTLHESLHKQMARFMLSWAKKHGIKYIITSIGVRAPDQTEQIIAAGSTEEARKKILEAGIQVLQHGTIPGIPGSLLNQGMLSGQNVIAVLFNSMEQGPDFKSSAQLCMAISKLVPGASCDISTLNKEAQIAEKIIKETDNEAKNLKEGMYQ